ncbi:unnamed protein product [Strongylus vulgaris]|uniref:Uncharacterized protein n=1 Tax=Strongylus vulgaris TaxID=40348 RepID=A0A3P7J3M1_STRVU|nr:unnamed protein product [Strongylus vulgaris]
MILCFMKSFRVTKMLDNSSLRKDQLVQRKSLMEGKKAQWMISGE